MPIKRGKLHCIIHQQASVDDLDKGNLRASGKLAYFMEREGVTNQTVACYQDGVRGSLKRIDSSNGYTQNCAGCTEIIAVKSAKMYAYLERAYTTEKLLPGSTKA